MMTTYFRPKRGTLEEFIEADNAWLDEQLGVQNDNNTQKYHYVNGDVVFITDIHQIRMCDRDGCNSINDLGVYGESIDSSEQYTKLLADYAKLVDKVDNIKQHEYYYTFMIIVLFIFDLIMFLG